MAPRASVVVSTYNQPDYLELVLRGYARQSERDFELVIADDGSGPETRAVMERYARDYPVPLIHAWHEDDGFRKATAVNHGVLRSSAPYLIFSDGDCVPSRQFVEQHLEAGRSNGYVVGGHVRLSEEISRGVDGEMVDSGAFERLATPRDRLWVRWVHLKNLYYIATNKRRRPKFYGLNFSVDRDSFYRVNGFDQNYRNNARDDSDLRNRMQLARIRARSLWHKCLVFHLYHPPHKARGLWTEADAYYYREDLPTRAPEGLEELQRELGESRSTD